MDNSMKLIIPAEGKNESFARSVVAAFCAQLNPNIDQINDIKTAVSEAVTNSIVHAYGNEGGSIEIDAYLEANSVHIKISDNGVGIEDIAKAKQPFFTTKPEQERTGLGFTVMESFMDTLDISKNPAGGMIVCMSKNFDVKPINEEQ